MRLIFDNRNTYKRSFFAIQCVCYYTMFFTKDRCESCQRPIPDELIQDRENANRLLCLEYNTKYEELWKR